MSKAHNTVNTTQPLWTRPRTPGSSTQPLVSMENDVFSATPVVGEMLT